MRSARGSASGRASAVGLLTASPLPNWLPDAFRAAAAGVLALVGLSGVVMVGSLVVHWSTMHDLFAITDSMFGQLSLTLLSVLYVPNVMVGTAAVAVGSSAHVGLATFSSFTVFGGDIPALPVLAAVPSPPLGAGVGGAADRCGGVRGRGRAAVRAAAAAAVACAGQAGRRRRIAAAAMALLGFAGGGRLGNFGDVGVDQATFAPAVFLWFVGIGALTLAMSGGIARRPRRAKPVAGPEVRARNGRARARGPATPSCRRRSSSRLRTDEMPELDDGAELDDESPSRDRLPR